MVKELVFQIGGIAFCIFIPSVESDINQLEALLSTDQGDNLWMLVEHVRVDRHACNEDQALDIGVVVNFAGIAKHMVLLLTLAFEFSEDDPFGIGLDALTFVHILIPIVCVAEGSTHGHILLEVVVKLERKQVVLGDLVHVLILKN